MIKNVVKRELERKGIITDNDYSFLDSNDNLKENIVFLTLGGSYAYGTNVETSDVDLRGVSKNTQKEFFLGRDHEVSTNEATDTSIYTTFKVIDLLCNTNPNIIEMFGSEDRNMVYISDKNRPIFDILFSNKEEFLSKLAFYTFAGYANSMMTRLFNKLGRTDEKIEQQNILRSIDNATKHIKDRYNVDVKTIFPIQEQDGFYIIGKEKSNNFDLIFKNVSKENAQSFLNEIASIFKDYNKLGKRNKSAIEHNKLNKHFMHLVRLTLMGKDILEKGKIETFREKENGLLMSIRQNENNEWITKDNKLTERGEKLVNKQMKILEDAKDNSKLQERPNKEKIDEIKISISKEILKG